MKCCLKYIPVLQVLLEWGGKAFNFVYIFEEIPFEWHILSYKTGKMSSITESTKEHKFFLVKTRKAVR